MFASLAPFDPIGGALSGTLCIPMSSALGERNHRNQVTSFNGAPDAQVSIYHRMMMLMTIGSGSSDEIVPSEHMRELWEIAQKSGRKKATWLDFPRGSHSACPPEWRAWLVSVKSVIDDTCIQPGYWTAIAKFLREVEQDDIKEEKVFA